ncbi:hypothetical protein K466DRAFT_284010 [Polyporus arcularius HHB13444]|uniref:Uncharacterized protein n=1 Tax=Polyporus arcularius HHB13444 TaxID=1314778 RepID=A0A5C3NZR5_9APHY|nr:hypothetical protein K466DRAFT_284010 [Polyporus arcularius HHB13444]
MPCTATRTQNQRRCSDTRTRRSWTRTLAATWSEKARSHGPWKEMCRLADEHVRTRPKVERSSFIGVVILFVRNATDGLRSFDSTDSPYLPGRDFVCNLSNLLWAKDRLTALWNRRDLLATRSMPVARTTTNTRMASHCTVR